MQMQDVTLESNYFPLWYSLSWEWKEAKEVSLCYELCAMMITILFSRKQIFSIKYSWKQSIGMPEKIFITWAATVYITVLCVQKMLRSYQLCVLTFCQPTQFYLFFFLLLVGIWLIWYCWDNFTCTVTAVQGKKPWISLYIAKWFI